MIARNDNPGEHFNSALEAFTAGELETAVACLRVGFFESGPGWLLYWLDRMDEHVETLGRFAPWIERRPSEVFREQCFVSMDTDNGQNLEAVAEAGLSRCVLWGSDYPHYDCIYPGAYKGRLESCREINPSVIEEVIFHNPQRYIGLS